VQTPGASRQLVNIGQLPPIDGNSVYPSGFSPGTQGTGVLVSSIQRVHQDSYDALFRGATSSQNYYSTESQVLTALQSSLGEPANGINSAFTAFQTAVQTLANNPQGNAERTGLLTSAQALVTSINSAGTAITTSQTQIKTQATQMISTINSTMDQIAALNGQIRAAKAVGDNPNTYQDQRDQLIDTLSTYLPTTTSIQADGSTLVTVNGLALVNDTVAYHLAAPIVGTNPDGTPALQVDYVTPPNPINPPAININGGQLGGLLDTYNNKLIPYSNQINDFANALATESDRISQAGYDITGQAGGQLFSPVVTQLPISAGNIQVGISTPSEVPAALATTAAGTLVQALNAGNATVDTTAQLTANGTLENPPAGPLSGNLTINVDGIIPPQTFDYSTVAASSTSTAATAALSNTITVANAASFAGGQVVVVGTGPDQELATVLSVAGNTITFTAGLTNAHAAGESVGGNASTIGGFINSFNAGHYGVTASFDSTSQTIAFSRDPANIDLVHRAAMQASGGTTTPAFTISDSNIAATGPAQPTLGTAATALLTALGANGINNVQQNSTNAYGSTSGANVTALATLFTASFGTPALQTTSPTVIAAPGAVTINPPVATPTAFSQINVGDVLTIDAGTAAQENVTVTAVNRNTGSISFVAQNAHLVAGYSITSAQTTTLQQYYANLVARVGQDTATANTGNTSQTTLASNINQVRQSTDGINIDEETQNLVKFQNAYGAAAHVMSILSSMLNTAINLGS
jgi:flagellar hook-associated protein 1 FlgK